MKVAIYTRVSTNKQEALAQEIKLRDYCGSQKWEIIKIYSDVISGKETQRPQFNLLFEDAHKRLFDLVLVWDISRFSRAGVEHTILKLKELDNLNIEFVSYNENYINTTGEFKHVFIALLSTFAKLQRVKISDNTKIGMEKARRKGKKIGKPKKILSSNDEKIILEEFEKQGSINKTAKIFKGRFSYGFIYNFLSKKGRLKKD